MTSPPEAPTRSIVPDARVHAADRLAVLAEVGAAVASTLDPREALDHLVRAVVPTFADYCTVYLEEPDGRIRTFARAVPMDDAAFPVVREPPPIVREVLTTGRGVLVTDVDDGVLAGAAASPEQLAALRRLGLRSGMAVPLAAHGRVLGAVTFGSTAPGRRYGAADLAVAEDLARRAAVALEHARLFDAVAASEARFRSLFEGVPVGLYRTSPDGRIIDVNPALLRLMGASDRESFLRFNVSSLYGDPEVRRRWRETMERDGVVRDFEVQVRRLDDGRLIWVRNSARVVRDDDGQVLWYDGVIEDVTERKTAEEARRASDERLAGVVGTLAEGVAILDRDGGVVFANAAAGRILGTEAAKLKGRRVLQADAGEDGPVARALRGETVRDQETAADTADGRRLVLSVNAAPYVGAGAEGVVVSFHDVTARRRAQEELDAARRQVAVSEKLSALGTLVSGVAHEIRTPLTYATNNMQLARLRLRRAAVADAGLATILPEFESFVSEAMSGMERINRLVSDLRRFTRLKIGDRVPARLDDVVAEAVALFRATHRGQITVMSRLEATPLIPVDRVQVQQVVMNLLENAADARPADGLVRVRTRFAGGVGEIEVQDAAGGIEPEVQKRMFDPFFTTRPEGTGLGLSIVKRIVDDHGGEILCASAPGKGSTFTVRLPLQPTGTAPT